MMGKPKIRFKGYNEDWEQRKLGEVVEFLDTIRKPLEGVKRISGPYPYYGASGIVDYVDGYLFDEELILLSEDGANITDRNYPVCFLASGKYWVNNHAHVLRTKDGNENNFICNSLERKDYRQYNSGMAMPKLNQEVCRSIPISCPSFDEQKKIGDYFRNFDHLITLHQHKCDEMKKLKKYMLQKMFPQNGKKVPEIRFDGFTNDWEQRKVGEFLSESREIGHKGDAAYKLTVKLWGKGVYEKKEVGSANTQFFTRHAGQFIYSKLDFLNCAFGVIPKELESLETTADVPAFDCEGVNPYFMFYTAIQPRFYVKNGMIADGSRKAKRIHVDIFLNMPFEVPKLEEQNIIVKLLDELDHLITLHQHKCDELQNLKKYMLQNMFV